MLQINFDPFPELSSTRLLLRRLTKADTQGLFTLRSDERVMQFIGREPAKTLDEIEKLIEQFNEGIDKNEAILWGIALKEDPQQIIGTICLWNMQPHNYRTEIGYILRPDHWGKGIMKEAIRLTVEYGFASLGLHSIEARTEAGNKASSALLENTGFVKEGYLKENNYFKGKFTDTIIYSRFQ
ncbi:MAG: GNAT family N-acetyltransferase [Bacteroidetes bacterium]|nr:MAG: GNAT family N-acetyltransferase [Bacteroidota bacterium]